MTLPHTQSSRLEHTAVTERLATQSAFFDGKRPTTSDL